MKWAACYIVLNGSDYIWYSIKSIYDFIKSTDGKIIIIEGANRKCYNQRNAAVSLRHVTSEGLSVDNTKDIIGGFIKDSPPGFIIHKRVGFMDEEHYLRQIYFNIIEKLPECEKPDYVLLIDDDELYKTDDLNRANKFLDINPYFEYLYIPQFFFTQDFKHIRVLDMLRLKNSYKAAGNMAEFRYDITGKEVIEEYQIKIVKWRDGLHYGENSACLNANDGKNLYGHPYYEKLRIAFDGCPWYHYSGLRNPIKQIERCLYHICECNVIDTKDHPEFLSYKSFATMHLRGYIHAVLEGYTKYPFVTQPFYGTHPKIMESHPAFNIDGFAIEEINKYIKMIEDGKAG